MGVRLLASLDGGEFGVDFLCDAIRRIDRDLQFAFAVTNGRYGRNYCGSADSEGFFKHARGVGCQDFVKGDRPFFARDLHFAKQSHDGVAGYARQNRAGKIGSDGHAVNHEHDVHNARLFNEFAVFAVEPHHVLVALGLGKLCG